MLIVSFSSSWTFAFLPLVTSWASSIFLLCSLLLLLFLLYVLLALELSHVLPIQWSQSCETQSFFQGLARTTLYTLRTVSSKLVSPLELLCPSVLPFTGPHITAPWISKDCSSKGWDQSPVLCLPNRSHDLEHLCSMVTRDKAAIDPIDKPHHFSSQHSEGWGAQSYKTHNRGHSCKAEVSGLKTLAEEGSLCRRKCVCFLFLPKKCKKWQRLYCTVWISLFRGIYISFYNIPESWHVT